MSANRQRAAQSNSINGEVVYDGDTVSREQAGAIATRLGFTLLDAAQAKDSVAAVQLVFARGWQLRVPGSTTRIDTGFSDKQLMPRLRDSVSRREKIVRAVLGRQLQARDTRVLDATAGFGLDALLLAAAGCSLSLVERNCLLAFLLEQALADAATSAEPLLAEAASRMTLYQRDSVNLMREWQGKAPEVVYLDPMFEATRGSAAAKKRMALLQTLLEKPGPGSNAGEMLSAALALAGRRVVVKRTPGAAWLDDRKPASSLASKAVRFDIYPV